MNYIKMAGLIFFIHATHCCIAAQEQAKRDCNELAAAIEIEMKTFLPQVMEDKKGQRAICLIDSADNDGGCGLVNCTNASSDQLNGLSDTLSHIALWRNSLNTCRAQNRQKRPWAGSRLFNRLPPKSKLQEVMESLDAQEADIRECQKVAPKRAELRYGTD